MAFAWREAILKIAIVAIVSTKKIYGLSCAISCGLLFIELRKFGTFWKLDSLINGQPFLIVHFKWISFFFLSLSNFPNYCSNTDTAATLSLIRLD